MGQIMTAAGCRVVYDLNTAGYSWWPAIVVGCTVTSALTILVWGGSRWAKALPFPRTMWLGPAVAFSVTALAFATSYIAYREALGALRAGNCNVVTGVVENFDPRPPSGHKLESFTVGAHRFEFADSAVTPGFHTTRAQGGPLGPGMCVRLTFRGNDILRAEVCAVCKDR